MSFDITGLKIAFTLSGLAVLLDAIGVAIPYWFYLSVTVPGRRTEIIFFGLWISCTTFYTEDGNNRLTMCANFDETDAFDVPKLYNEARVLELLGILTTFAVMIMTGLRIFYKKASVVLMFIVWPVCFIAGAFMITGVIVFCWANEMNKRADALVSGLNFKLHASFGLCLVAGITNLVASLTLFKAAKALPLQRR